MLGLPHSLIRHYDSIGWIPTIGGCLSLDLIDDARSIFGDVDKYSVRFERSYGFNSAHHFIASSLHTVNDIKSGTDYERSFRYIFTGSINDEKDTLKFLDDYGLSGDEPLKAYIKEEGLLIGRLAIVVEIGHKLSRSEVDLLKGLKDLTKINNSYLYEYHVNAVSMQNLEMIGKEMHERWKLLTDTARQIEEEEEIDRPRYLFEVALTRDGILLMKDVTSDEWKHSYAAPNTPDDYTKNIRINRLFGVAMNYVKYLFHSNYHHNKAHDTYLPASNLHPIKNEFSCPYELDFSMLFRHQLDAFLIPVIRLERDGFSSYTVDSKNIILYAKAFIKVFKENKLVKERVAVKTQEHCDILEKEIERMTVEHNAIFRAFITNHNLFVIVPALLTFVLTCLEIANLLHLSVKQYVISFQDIPADLYAIGKFMFLASFGYYSLYIISRTRALKKMFQPKSESKNILFVNSNLKENSGRFSYCYELYIAYNTLILWMGRHTFGIIRVIIIIVLFILAIYAFICCFYGKWIVLY